MQAETSAADFIANPARDEDMWDMLDAAAPSAMDQDEFEVAEVLQKTRTRLRTRLSFLWLIQFRIPISRLKEKLFGNCARK